MKIRALEIVEELRIKRADKQVSDLPWTWRPVYYCQFCDPGCVYVFLFQFTWLDRKVSYLTLITILWENTITNYSFVYVSISKQSTLLLDAFNKDRASLPQPLPNPPPLAPLPVVTPDARTQEMINEKLKKAEDLGKSAILSSVRLYFFFA